MQKPSKRTECTPQAYVYGCMHAPYAMTSEKRSGSKRGANCSESLDCTMQSRLFARDQAFPVLLPLMLMLCTSSFWACLERLRAFPPKTDLAA